MPTVIVNNQEIVLDENQRLNGIQAASLIGEDVPHYCWHPGLSVVASCRMCLVETGRKDPETGKISMMPKLVPGCQTPATDGAVFVTNSEKVKNARAMVEEDLLVRHPIDCPICDKAGECSLQDYHFEHGQEQRRADIKPFTSRRRTLGDTVTLFVDRCVMCSRCVRFTREISGTKELMVVNRGAHEEIDVFPGYPLDNKMSGNVCDLCPVGALGDKDFLYKQRVWFMNSHDNVCAGCSTGCSIKVEENQDHIYRLKPRENPHVNQWWMCDDGRYGWKHVHDPQRVTSLKLKVGGEYQNLEWSDLPDRLERMLGDQKLAVVLSPFVTVEEAYLLCRFLKSIDDDATIAVGPVPQDGVDESFANGFTIRAEKCPNRKGVEAIASHFQRELLNWNDFLTLVSAADAPSVVWITGGYPSNWHDETAANCFANLQQLIVQDMFSSSLWQRATLQIPGAAFAERDGSYVNHSDRLQSFGWAVRPPAGVQVEGQLYWRLLQRTGLYNAQSVREEIAQEIAYFSALLQDVPTVGVDLKVHQLAEV